MTGVKNMLAGEQQAAVTVAVEGLMEAKPIPELEAFATFDPKVAWPPFFPEMLKSMVSCLSIDCLLYLDMAVRYSKKPLP